jgi:hypothetical protein
MRIQMHKVLSGAFFGPLFGLQIHHSNIRWNRLGREAFIAYQNQEFDRSIASPVPGFVMVLVAIFFTLLFVGAYELLSVGLSKIIKPPDDGTGPIS